MKRWYYTAFMLLLYVAIFRIWQSFPGRAMFLIGGGLTVGLMAAGMIRAARRGYFANRRDLCLHALVLVDVGLEGSLYEWFRIVSLSLLGDEGNIARFHESHNFYVCAAAFALLVGGYRWWALRTKDRLANRTHPDPGVVNDPVAVQGM